MGRPSLNKKGDVPITAKQFTLFVLSIAIGLAVVLGGCSPFALLSGVAAMTPEEVVEGFYNWYLGYIGDPASGRMRNPLANGAYRSSAYLTDEFIQQVDEILASFERGGYDPFLCAHDIPGEFTVEKAAVSGEEASVFVHKIWNSRKPYELIHDVEVRLRLVDGQWQIADIVCSGSVAMTPEEVVEGFYNWYLGYIGDRASGEMRNPLVDGAYRSSEYLAGEFVQKVDEIIASFNKGGDKGGYDPFLCAQDIPRWFTLEKAAVSGEEASVVVHDIWNPGTQYELIRDVTVALRVVDGQWKIADVICPEVGADKVESIAAPPEKAPASESQITGWQVFRDDEYGFQIQYPADWTLQKAKTDDSGGDIPIKRVLGFSPQDWGGGVMPVSIEVSVGTLEELQSIYPVPAAGQSSTTIINGYTVLIWESPYDEVFYIFEHPSASNLRVAVRDSIGGPGEGRNPYISGLKDIVNRMILSLKFFSLMFVE